jgi:hypothetical protein
VIMKLPPIPTAPTALIAQRTLILVTKKGRQRVQIRIGRPVRDVPTAAGLDWRCPVSITGRSKRPLRGIGVDSLQAVVNALKLVEVELNARERERKGRFEWLGESWHGMPAFEVAPPYVYAAGRTRAKRASPRKRHRQTSVR